MQYFNQYYILKHHNNAYLPILLPLKYTSIHYLPARISSPAMWLS